MAMKVSINLVKTAYTRGLSRDYSLIKHVDMKYPTGTNPVFQDAMSLYGIQDVYADAPARQHLEDPTLSGALLGNAGTLEMPLISNILQVFGPQEVKMIVSEDCKEVFFLKSKQSLWVFNQIGRPLTAYFRDNKKYSCYEKAAIKRFLGFGKQLSIGDRMEMSEHLKTCLICREWQHLIPIIDLTEADSKTDIKEEPA